MEVYGKESATLGEVRGVRYARDDAVMSSQDMTMMSLKGLNVTGLMTIKGGVGKAGERLDTQEGSDDELDLLAIDKMFSD